MTDTQPTSIDEVVEEIGRFVYGYYSESNNYDRAEECTAEELVKLRSKLTTLVEQARGEGMDKAIEYIKHHADPVDIEAGFKDIVWESLLDSARTISSDSKNV